MIPPLSRGPDPFELWRGLNHGVPAGTIRLVLADVDGVVTPGEGHAADLSVLNRLAEYNRRTLHDPAIPAITLCTGRPAPYVEALAQAVGSFLPSVFEQGAGLFEPRSFRYLLHPSLPPDAAARLARFRLAIEESLLRDGRAFVQPGKEVSMTLYPVGDTSLDEIAAVAAEVSRAQGDPFTVNRNVTGVELRPPGIDKGVGATWLAELVGLSLAAMAGVGDSDPDVSFLELVGYPGAPANGTPAVRAAARYVASAPYGEGLIEIVERVIGQNRGR